MIARRRAVMHLKNYKKVEQAMQDTAREMERAKAEIAAASDPRVNKYGGSAGGGYHLLSEVESQADRRDKLGQKYRRLECERVKMANYLRRVDRALSILTEQEREIVRAKYIDGSTWVKVALSVGYSEGGCRRIARRAVERIAPVMDCGQYAAALEGMA